MVTMSTFRINDCDNRSLLSCVRTPELWKHIVYSIVFSFRRWSGTNFVLEKQVLKEQHKTQMISTWITSLPDGLAVNLVLVITKVDFVSSSPQGYFLFTKLTQNAPSVRMHNSTRVDHRRKCGTLLTIKTKARPVVGRGAGCLLCGSDMTSKWRELEK